MNLTIIDKKDTQIKTQNKTLIIDTQKVPFHLIDTLIIVGKNTLQTNDITTMSANDIQILLLSYDYAKSSIISSTSTKSAELKIIQYNAVSSKQLIIAKFILSKKINNHIKHLLRHEIIIDHTPIMQKVENANDLDTLLGIEGSFSRLYFGHYFGLFPKTLHKNKRSKRPPLDPLNAMLSWNYTLFYNIIAIRLMGFGFEVGLGFLHRPFRSHMALASDILEIFRSDINAFVYDLFLKKVITISDFSKKGGVYLRYDGRKKVYKPFRKFHTSLEPQIDKAISDLRSQL